jgi:hypothetical protein
MKLDNLTSLELACYRDWNTADHMGGDCDTQGYAWAAWDEDRIIITENDHGFVDANTYDADDGTGQEAYNRRVKALEHEDELASEREAMAWNSL